MNQNSENQNGSNTVVGAIKFIAGFSFFVGLVSFISGINSVRIPAIPVHQFR